MNGKTVYIRAQVISHGRQTAALCLFKALFAFEPCLEVLHPRPRILVTLLWPALHTSPTPCHLQISSNPIVRRCNTLSVTWIAVAVPGHTRTAQDEAKTTAVSAIR